MATNRVQVTLQIRHDEAADWTTRNPVLAAGEYGLESDTFLIKVGDGVRDWAHLPYLNTIDTEYFNKDSDGTLTFSDKFLNTIHTLEAAAGQAITQLIVTEPPVNDTDVPNKKYVDDMIAQSGHLKREIVETLPAAAIADPNTLYMKLASDGNHYEEYMVINGVWDMVGSTGDGTAGEYILEPATTTKLGGVKAAYDPNDPTLEYLNVTQEGFMTLNKVSTSRLFVPDNDVLVIHGGTA